MTDAVSENFLNQEFTVAAAATKIWYPPLRYDSVTIRILPGTGATGDVKYSTDSKAVIESGTGITWTALHADLTDQTSDSARDMTANVNALLLSSTTAETVFQLNSVPKGG